MKNKNYLVLLITLAITGFVFLDINFFGLEEMILYEQLTFEKYLIKVLLYKINTFCIIFISMYVVVISLFFLIEKIMGYFKGD